MTEAPLRERVALVTGASRGIGRAIAVELGRLGATVGVNYRADETAARETVARVEAAGGKARAYRADVADADEAGGLVESIVRDHGHVDILVNNAGIQKAALVHKMSDADWHHVLAVNLHAAFYLARAVLPGMLERGSGHIVNVASASSVVASKGAASYVASKHAIVGLTKAVAVETAGKGVLVNAVAPGLTHTDLVDGLSDEARQGLMKMVPLKRIADPEEIAALVGFVVTRGSYSTGNVFHASGGVVMG